MLHTRHQYIDKYPILKEDEKLILGTIHPHEHKTFDLPFFYGNVLSIWKILSEAYPNEITMPISLDSILTFLKKRKIGISDMIIECDRINNSALDKDLLPTELNEGLIEQIKNSKINEIFFTSGFGKNNAFKLYNDKFLKLYGQELKKVKAEKVALDNKNFGRPVKLTILFSPAPTANIGISRSKQYQAEKGKYTSPRPIHDFRVDHYRSHFK